MSWSYGYVTDLGYTHGYYRELSPAILRFACLCGNVEPQLSDRPAYLELGFGQGLPVAIHAAANDGSFWGTDFNPEHAVHGRELAAASGADIHLFDQSFEELSARTDLPDFDIIALHGIWSWISEDNRKRVTEIIRRRLRPGGIAYISYNCLPGWAPAIPIRQLLTLYGDYGGMPLAGARSMVEGALAFSASLIKTKPVYFHENPAAVHHFERMATSSRNYIAHEYLNADWHIPSFAEMVRSLDEAKVSFVGSARLLNRIDGLHLTEEGRKLLATIEHPIFRETVRDYLVNQRFRCDVFVKGPRLMSAARQREAWHAQRFVLTACGEDIPKKVASARGDVELPQKIYPPIIAALAENSYAPKGIDDLMQTPALRGLKVNEIVEALVVLVGAGFAAPAQAVTDDVAQRCQAFNQYVRRRALMNTDLNHMASPVTGGGITVPHIQQMFMRALDQGRSGAHELASFVWEFLDGIGERLIRDGKRVESKEEHLKEFTPAAQAFLDRGHALLRALQVA